MDGPQGEDGPGAEESCSVRIPPLDLEGHLAIPPRAGGIVLFAHGSGSSRFSPRNAHVAAGLRAAGLATLLFDLLTPEEAADRAKVFDVELLAERLLHATAWIPERAAARDLPLGYFGASTGAPAALIAAAKAPRAVGAVVSRGGRPDLAGPALAAVRTPTLLIVGRLDVHVLGLNRAAFEQLHCPKDLQIVPGAGHLFEEPGTLDVVIDLARQWFGAHLVPQFEE